MNPCSSNSDLPKGKDSMRLLIEKDMAETEERIEKMRRDRYGQFCENH